MLTDIHHMIVQSNSTILNSSVTWLPLKHFMWMLYSIILTEKLNEKTCHMIVQSNSTILLLSNPEFSSNLTSLETQFMWILWFIILTEKINEETCGVITCMSLHAKYVIILQQFFHLSQIKAKGFSPLLNNKGKPP